MVYLIEMKKKLFKLLSYYNVQQFPLFLFQHIFLQHNEHFIITYFCKIPPCGIIIFYQIMFFSNLFFFFALWSFTYAELPPEVHKPLVHNFRFNKRCPWNLLSTFMLLKSKPTCFLYMLWPLFLCHLQDEYHNLSAGEALQIRALTVVTIFFLEFCRV